MSQLTYAFLPDREEEEQVYDPRKVRKLTPDDLLKTYW